MDKNVSTLNIILQVVIILILLYMISKNSEQLCIKQPHGYVTDVPASSIASANSALVHSSSLGQAPLGDPRFWLPSTTPAIQGQYGLYQPASAHYDINKPFDRSSLMAAASALPVYTDKPLPAQCTPLN